jgi:hypothetical protein
MNESFLETIVRLASRATFKEWQSRGSESCYGSVYAGRQLIATCHASVAHGKDSLTNADFIACANPVTVMALVTEINRLRIKEQRKETLVAL